MADLSKLHPYVKTLTDKLISECAKQGIKIIITCGYRTKEEQDKLYAQGRTMSGIIVTNAKGGYSMHNYGLAIDFAPVVNGKVNWNDIALFKKVGAIGLKIGFDSYGGNWTSFKDYPHLQWTNGLSDKEIYSDKVPTIPVNKVEKSELDIALDKLVNKGVISTPTYWSANAKSGLSCQGDYVQKLIINMANKL